MSFPIASEIIRMARAGELEFKATSYDGDKCYDAELKGQKVHFDPSFSFPYPFGAIVINYGTLEETWIRLSREQRKELKDFLVSRITKNLQEMFPNAFKG